MKIDCFSNKNVRVCIRVCRVLLEDGDDDDSDSSDGDYEEEN